MKTKPMYMLLAMTLTMAQAFAAKPMSDEEYVRVNGGMAQTRGKGWVAAIDCRATPKPEDFKEGLEFVARELSTTISNRVGKSFSVASAAELVQESGANVAVFVIDDPAMPISLSCPEERWAMLNAAKASSDSPVMSKFSRRMSFLFERQCCRALGSDEGAGSETCFRTILKPSDLDKIESMDLPLNVTTSIADTMSHRGMEPIDWGTYRDACEAGRAPAPTNEIQKAIWDSVHAIPATPMKIEFDPKKGR